MEILSRVDHLVYATPELERGIAEIHALLGIEPIIGGAHPGRGTRNALLALGPSSYLEVVGPDPDQPAPASPRWFGVDDLQSSRLVTWAVNGRRLAEVRDRANEHGILLGDVQAGRRQRSDGAVLTWEFTEPDVLTDGGIVPFLIDWNNSPHPARTSPPGALLQMLRAVHPAPARMRHALLVLGLYLAIDLASQAGLIATVDSPRGVVQIR